MDFKGAKTLNALHWLGKENLRFDVSVQAHAVAVIGFY